MAELFVDSVNNIAADATSWETDVLIVGAGCPALSLPADLLKQACVCCAWSRVNGRRPKTTQEAHQTGRSPLLVLGIRVQIDAAMQPIMQSTTVMQI